MALQMTYTDATGTTHEASYWRVGQTNISQTDERGMVVLLGYHDKQARQDRRQPVGMKSYPVDPETYAQYFASDELNPEGKNPAKAAYDLALATLDTGGKSFFDGAETV